jgi:hypothetical protein
MAYEPEKGPTYMLGLFLFFLLYPYFSAANEKTRLHLAGAVGDFYRHCEDTELQTKFDELYSESHA